MRKPGAVGTTIVVASALFVAAPAQAGSVVRPGESTGLGLFGRSVPNVLKTAKADPYAMPAETTCEAIAQEVAALDQVLGPDADTAAQPVKVQARAGKLLSQAVRGLIPHRDVVRFVTGAGRSEKALADAAMAGWARRGYLKGLAASQHCQAPATAPPAPEAAPVDDALVAAQASAVPDATVRTAAAIGPTPVLAVAPADLAAYGLAGPR